MHESNPQRQPRLSYFQLLLSVRYLRSRISAVAALLALAFGVSIIVIALSIMGGYLEKLRENTRGEESHLLVVGSSAQCVTRIARLEKLVSSVKQVAATAPFIKTFGMYRSGQFNPCEINGILPRAEVNVSRIGRYVLRPGELEDVLAALRIDTEQGAPDSGRPLESEQPEATKLIDGILHSPQRADLSGDELEAFFKRPFREKLLEKHNASILPDLQGRIPPSCLVGIHLLLDRQMFLGQIVTMITLDAKTSEPKSKKFLVAGAFKTGNYKIDSSTIYAHVDTLKNMLGLFDLKSNSFRYDGLRVAVKDLSRLEETSARISNVLHGSGIPEYKRLGTLTWKELRRNLLRAVKIEKFVIYFLLVLLVGFTACMVFLMLLLTAIEKTRDIGILVALGATPNSVIGIFLTNGMLICSAGTALGLLAGYLFCLYINPIHDWVYIQTGLRLFPAEIYQMDRIPIAFHITDVLLSVAPAIAFVFLASLVPAVWATRRDPIKAIHHE